MVSGVGVKVKDGGTAHQRPGKLLKSPEISGHVHCQNLELIITWNGECITDFKMFTLPVHIQRFSSGQ